MFTVLLLNAFLAVTTLEPYSFDAADALDSVPPRAEGPTVEVRGSFLAGPPSVSPMSGGWQLSWDDQVDGQLNDSPKRCDLELRCVEGQISGEFKGPVAGRIRDAIISGERVQSSAGELIILRQREPGYQCSYQVFLGHTDRAQPPHGVWHDSRGGSGEFELLKHQ